MQWFKKHIDKLLIILFVLMLLTPTFVQFSGLEGRIINSENREKAAFPQFDMQSPMVFLREFKTYYKDNFGLRYTLSNAYIKFKYNVLHESPIPSKVIVGKNDFLFLGKSFSNVVNESLGYSMFTDQQLVKFKSAILDRKAWLTSQNIAFYAAVAPTKHNVYRENLPFNTPELYTRKEQLIDYLKTEIKFDLIDLGQDFETKKEDEQLYHKYDSHWNNLGGFYATQILIDAIQKDFDIPSLQLSNYEISSKKKQGDLMKMLNLPLNEEDILLKPIIDGNIEQLKLPKYYANERIYEGRYRNPSKKLKVLVFRDSFCVAMLPYITQSFGESTFVWTHKFDKDLILKEKPDIVIMEYSERYLERLGN